MLRFGLIGCGAMGRVIASHVSKKWRGKAQWVGAYDKVPQAVKRLSAHAGRRMRLLALDELVSRSDWIIEAASPAAVPGVLKQCLARKKNIVIMSSGGLLSCAPLIKKAQALGVRILVPSGAIAGLDAVKAAGLGTIQQVTLTTTKHPDSLRGAPYLVGNNIDLDTLRQAKVIFDGSAASAMAGFPANINVGATLTLAAGLGADKVQVRIVADPHHKRNVHEIRLTGSSGSLVTRVENVPSEANPKTSALAVLSACAAIDGIFSTVRIGT